LFDGEIWYGVANYYTQAMAARALFGPRIPSADELVELQRKADELDRIHAVWGLTKGTMPNAETDTTLG
jgi:hypothetical protein